MIQASGFSASCFHIGGPFLVPARRNRGGRLLPRSRYGQSRSAASPRGWRWSIRPRRDARRCGAAGCSASRISRSATTGSPRPSAIRMRCRTRWAGSHPHCCRCISRSIPMLAAGVAWRLRRPALDAGYVLIFATAWIATEYLRGTMLTGYPWNPLSELWLPTPIAASGRYLGTYALSGVAVLTAGRDPASLPQSVALTGSDGGDARRAVAGGVRSGDLPGYARQRPADPRCPARSRPGTTPAARIMPRPTSRRCRA